MKNTQKHPSRAQNADYLHFDGRTFETENSLHEYRLAFDLEYFVDYYSQF
jgi:hypothetical protein